jgi:hypothetical protein
MLGCLRFMTRPCDYYGKLYNAHIAYTVFRGYCSDWCEYIVDKCTHAEYKE